MSSVQDDIFLPRSHIVLPGEDAEHYSRIENEMVRNINPTDIFERLWIRDIADLVWESLRLRRMKGDLLSISTPKGLRRVLDGMQGIGCVDTFVYKWSMGDEFHRSIVDDHLKKMNVSMDAVRAEALVAILPDLERIEYLITSIEIRRNVVLREISRHRDAMAARLARVTAAIEDVEFAEIKSIGKQKPIQHGQPT